MTIVQITLPDNLAKDAQAAGLLSPERMEKILREQLKAGFSKVTVRIEQEEVADASAEKAQADLQALMANPMFGMWADRKDMADVGAYIRAVRAPRLNADGTRRKN